MVAYFSWNINVINQKCNKRFGGIVAVNDSSFHVENSTICSLIGPNGAGKSTLFNCISRVYPIDEGEIYLENTRIDTMPAHKIATLGVGGLSSLQGY